MPAVTSALCGTQPKRKYSEACLRELTSGATTLWRAQCCDSISRAYPTGWRVAHRLSLRWQTGSTNWDRSDHSSSEGRAAEPRRRHSRWAAPRRGCATARRPKPNCCCKAGRRGGDVPDGEPCSLRTMIRRQLFGVGRNLGRALVSREGVTPPHHPYNRATFSSSAKPFCGWWRKAGSVAHRAAFSTAASSVPRRITSTQRRIVAPAPAVAPHTSSSSRLRLS